MTARTLFAVVLVSPLVSAQQEWVAVDGPVRAYRQTAFDTARGRLVQFGAEAETWEFDGSRRLQRANTSSLPGPIGRTRGTMAADDNGNAILFSGAIGGALGTILGDTWRWDGAEWRRLTDIPSPAPRLDGEMTFDSRRQRYVLYGGQGVSGLLNDTWEHDGTRWFQITTATTPFPSRGGFAYDSDRGVCVLVSAPGILGQPMLVNEYDGTNWRARPPIGSWPTHRQNLALAYDPARQSMVMLGGAPDGDEIWDYDGNRWQLVRRLSAPLRSSARGYYDAGRGAVVVVGGQVGTPPVEHTDAFAWDGTTLTQLRGDHSPPIRFGFAWMQDVTPGQMIMVGGSTAAPPNETWRWDGVRWSLLQPSTQPVNRRDAGTAFDPVRQQALMFAGFSVGSYLDDLWAWDGVDWSLLATGSGPSERSGPAMAFDSGRDRAVIFGGRGPATIGISLRNDTWEWDGDGWQQAPAGVAPRARMDATLAYDEARGVTVLFGGRIGFTAADQLNDTWEWDGVSWSQVTPPTSPPNLLSPRLYYDPLVQRTRLAGWLGGIIELWEYDGATWTSLGITTPAINGGPDVVWDPRRQQATMYEGHTIKVLTDVPAVATTYGNSCLTASTLMVRTRARIGDQNFGFETHVGATGEPAFFALGTGPASVPLGGSGCTFLVSGLALLTPVAPGPNGTATLPIPLPLVNALRGLSLYGQALVREPGTVSAYAFSRGLQVTIGE
ncbi:MAG: kelch repeat-containing protein [Planctomycetota bacterium]